MKMKAIVVAFAMLMFASCASDQTETAVEPVDSTVVSDTIVNPDTTQFQLHPDKDDDGVDVRN